MSILLTTFMSVFINVDEHFMDILCLIFFKTFQETVKTLFSEDG